MSLTPHTALTFRATFNDPGDKTLDRPVQIFSSTRKEIDEWVQKKLEGGGDTAYCLIYETIEELRDIKRKPPKPAEVPKYESA